MLDSIYDTLETYFWRKKLKFCHYCNVVVDSNLQVRVVFFKVSLEFLSLVNFTNNFHNFIILLNLLKFN